ncbi:hypothetical protein O6H91_09G018400 [Diphasiastrum complanatum]|uniref:Uncharacterized protein n=1 Tax=Diphasiastrum complanatum TaxID=34168 RepID=A0ACC2CLR2_DIPCM|nr:hypothetical protein O6H91_09G018400 [Diphasiastrum complanatum]
MGGGAMLRSVAKLVSAATPERMVSPRCPPGVSDAVVRSNPFVASSSCQSAMVGSSVSCQPQASHTAASEMLLVEQEGWVFAGDEELHEHMVRDRLVFAKPPTRQEVEDATLELKNVLRLGIFVAPEIDAVRSYAVSYSAEDESISGEGRTTELSIADETSTSQSKTISPDENARQIFHSKEGMGQAGYLTEAFRLLLSKPSVQGVIMALAEDKAVWDAFSKNDAVKVFRSFQQ